ncbi:non-ribosomal peptide synthetase [Streptomyces sp. TRM66268-LWL]|uniref:Non-ribosomal peptide synthetase n=1 Tax=Streptomyces polyasparticus TaxID=2767826 RepID=A0ABR7SE81_9ACTN|nr:amino acid adenylation domain-containing protein [Streptomyces polyasparticus]MBC9713282.1 non-ribosomal peptide synthetase [Streptomyces polyasparticus]
MNEAHLPSGAHPRVDALLLERWDRTPALPALIAGEQTVTMGELKERVLRAAGALRAHGVGPGARVVVHHERSVDFVVAILGVAFAGGAHASLDPRDPASRVLATARDCAPKAVLTNSLLGERFSALEGVPVLTPQDCASHASAPPAHGSPDDPVTLIYTSGSTGAPKASLISHRALVSRLHALQTTNRLDERDRMVHHTACSFDMHLGELYWPLLAGAAVVLAEPDRQRDADHLAALLRDHAVTTLYCVVSLLDLFLRARPSTERYDGLRQVLTGGEPLPPELVTRFHARSTATLTNLYGPSECTIHCTTWLCPRDPDPKTVLIGSAVPETDLRVCDGEGNPVPDGEPGELYIGGAGLALGYLGRPDLTAERFVSTPHGRMYRSGDLVRVAGPGGALEFLGRVDRQVKIRGIRIEPGEIEATALLCPGVAQAAVVAHGTGDRKALAAFVVRAADGPADPGLADRVREHTRERLPQYMVPRTVEVLDELPLTANGKLDRAALEKRAAASAPAFRAEGPTARPDLDSLVREVWQDVLGTDAIAPDDDFFDIGGDSFGVVRVMEHLHERLATRVPLAVLLRNPTPQSFTEALRELVGGG